MQPGPQGAQLLWPALTSLGAGEKRGEPMSMWDRHEGKGPPGAGLLPAAEAGGALHPRACCPVPPAAAPGAQDVGALHTRSATSFSIRQNHCLLLHLRFSTEPVLLPAAEKEWGLIS